MHTIDSEMNSKLVCLPFIIKSGLYPAKLFNFKNENSTFSKYIIIDNDDS